MHFFAVLVFLIYKNLVCFVLCLEIGVKYITFFSQKYFTKNNNF